MHEAEAAPEHPAILGERLSSGNAEAPRKRKTGDRFARRVFYEPLSIFRPPSMEDSSLAFAGGPILDAVPENILRIKPPQRSEFLVPRNRVPFAG